MTAAVTIMPPGADIFASGCEALVNPVNCVGVSGKGLALEFKRRFPVAVGWYADIARSGGFAPGSVREASAYLGDRRVWILFAATKDHWRNPSEVDWIAEALIHIETLAREHLFRSVAVPALGCGEGGLMWHTEVEPLILASAARMAANGCAVKVYPPR